jgi:hypothetical protein
LPSAKARIAPRTCFEMSQCVSLAVELGTLLRGPIPCAAARALSFQSGSTILSGSAALRYDAVSGDGTGASVRAALHCCAVLNSVAEARSATAYFEHYDARLSRAFSKHSEACFRLYSEAKLSSEWDAELERLRAAANAPIQRKPLFRMCTGQQLPAPQTG